MQFSANGIDNWSFNYEEKLGKVKIDSIARGLGIKQGDWIHYREREGGLQGKSKYGVKYGR